MITRLRCRVGTGPSCRATPRCAPHHDAAQQLSSARVTMLTHTPAAHLQRCKILDGLGHFTGVATVAARWECTWRCDDGRALAFAHDPRRSTTISLRLMPCRCHVGVAIVGIRFLCCLTSLAPPFASRFGPGRKDRDQFIRSASTNKCDHWRLSKMLSLGNISKVL